MYSWKTIRTACAVLLLLPIVHLAYLVSQDMLKTMRVAPETWANEVAAYAEEDRATQLPVHPVLVVGGRPATLWQGLDDLLSPRPVLMRGLSEATVSDITHYHGELVGYYQPSALVLLPGNSEFHIRDNKSAQELATAIRKLIELDESFGAERDYYIFTPLKTPLYPEDYARIDEASRLLERWARETPRVSILDANALLSLAGGTPSPDFFRLDGVNLNESGYLRLSLLLMERMEQQEATL